LPWPAWKTVAVRSWNEASEDNIGLVAAGVAFYGFLAIVPLLGAVVLCYGIFAQPDTVLRHMDGLMAVMPPDVARAIGQQLLELVVSSDGRKGVGVLVSLAVALFGARNGAGAILSALNIAYGEREKRGIIALNLTSLALTAGAVLAAILAAFSVAALASVSKLLSYANDFAVIAGTALTYVLLLIGGAVGAAALYRLGPSRSNARWSWITPGSMFASIAWLGLTSGFGTYVSNVGQFDATYGSLGALVGLLTWLYLSCYVLLLGAELNAELEHQTAVDTTTGAPRPLGNRKARMADHVAHGTAAGQDKTPEGQQPAPQLSGVAYPPLQSPLPAPKLAHREHESFAASRIAAHVARIGGLPKLGWITSACVTLGLAMLRRRGHTAPGLTLVATAACVAWARRAD
jgi:membrane protein